MEEMCRKCLVLMAIRTLQMYMCNHAEESSLTLVTDLVERFLDEAGRKAGHYRDLAGRSEGNFADVFRALEDLGITRSQLMTPVPKHAGVGKVPSFPIESGVNLPSVLEIEEDMPVQPTPDIPSWLPPLPEKHTYIRTEIEDEKMAPKEAQGLRNERRTRVEGYLERMHEVVKKSKILTEEEEMNSLNIKEANVIKPTIAPIHIDQAYADLHCVREVKGRKLVVEEQGDEDEGEYQLRMKAERIVSDQHKK